ncbi:unnamed protein product [Heligmosomoides polygyrus]|uniref:7TM_GPCR_Srx domain-containing protein n=1 Tax=Heligmosomoides polygyrus TaxID=6339 RepID=A0A183FZI5_HELPZ|nr:unnamed protein product [Heligmosomoides polygyrus]
MPPQRMPLCIWVHLSPLLTADFWFMYFVVALLFQICRCKFLGGFFVSVLSRRYRNFSLTPTMLCHAVCAVIFQGLVFFAFPNWATVMPTGGGGTLFTATVPIAVFCGLLVGLADSTITTARTVVCQIAVPHRRPQAFSLSRLVQVTIFLKYSIMRYAETISHRACCLHLM